MDRPRLTPQYHEHDTGQDLDSGAACVTECTGLLHRAPESREEREAAETVDGGGDQPLEEDCTPAEAATEPDGEAEADAAGQDEDTEESGTAE